MDFNQPLAGRSGILELRLVRNTCVALVLDMLRRSDGFTNLATESVRGLPRPRDDKYAASLSCSDSVYAVWGARRRTTA